MTTTRLARALILAALVGCGGGTGGSTGTGGTSGGGPIPLSEYVAAVLAAGCNSLVQCGLFPDQATCLTSDQVVPHLYETLVADVASGKLNYDPAQGRACVDTWNSLACTRTATAASQVEVICGAVFTPSVTADGTCFFDQECPAGDNCLIDYTSCSTDCCPGNCVAPPPTVGLGADCTAYGTVTCAAGTTCTPDANGSTSSCQTIPGLGAPCVLLAAVPCAGALYCDSVSGTCKVPVSTGGACNPTGIYLDCDDSKDLCDRTTKVCTPMRKPGSPCTPSYSECLPYATCDATTRTCVEKPVVGQACDPNGGWCILGGGQCDQTSQTCVLMPTAGACS